MRNGRVYSSSLLLATVGYAFPLLMFSIGLFWLTHMGILLALPVGVVLAALSFRFFYLAFRGGVSREDEEVVVRGWIRSIRIQLGEIVGVRLGRTRYNQPEGFAVLRNGVVVPLWGTFVLHRHSLGSPYHCPACERDRDSIMRAAELLEVDVELPSPPSPDVRAQ